MLYQRTVKSTVHGRGVGLHCGDTSEFTILPAPPDTGLVFVRTDVHPSVEIPARSENVTYTRLATTLGKDGVTIQTVEHLVAALYGLGVDNARILIDGAEVPILDGSAQRFVDLIREAGGTVAQRRPKRFIVIRRPVTVRDEGGRKMARLEPASSFRLACTIDFDHPLVSHQHFEMTFSDTAFVREIARARTFGFGKDVDAMHAAGLAKGGSLENAVVIDDFSIRNAEGLRYPDEFVRHKLLDTIGDLALLGAPIIGRYVGLRSGHSLNTALAAKLTAEKRAFEVVEFRQRRELEDHQLELPAFRIGGLQPA
jgi:UDP-3-O-[3-hydroxymyristoyl] N-acetylglucosamine deacetylase